ncbi:PLP-dependent cysteine synthase family protein [Streptococcus fryi]
MAIVNHITELVGNTPVVKLNRMVPEGAADVYVKLEYFNPGSSVKDRAALNMVEVAEKNGDLKPGQTIVEPTSGNTGIGLAWVGSVKGYPVTIVMPESMSLERRQLIKAFGANLVLTPASEGMKGAIQKAEEIAFQTNAFMPQQFNNLANPQAHMHSTGLEILADFGETGKTEGFLVGISSGAAIWAAIEVAKKLGKGKKVLTILADNGERYLSTSLFEDI